MTRPATAPHAMHRVLVTGGAGFIGSNLVRHLLAARPEVRIVDLDALTYAGSLENLYDLPDPARHTFVHGDIRDRALVTRLLSEHAIDTVIHVAAESHVNRSIAAPAAFVETNVLGTHTLLAAARAAWGAAAGRRFHQVSTDEVYGPLAPGAPRSARANRIARARRTPRPRRRRTTWSARTSTPTGSTRRSRNARTTTAPTSSPRS